MVNQKNSALAIAAVVFVSGSIFCGEQEVEMTTKQALNVVAAAVVVIEKEAAEVAPEVIVIVEQATDVIEETTEEVVA